MTANTAELLAELLAELPARVAQGAAALDQHFGPSWVDEIQLERLDLREFDRCVIGQLSEIHSEKFYRVDQYDELVKRLMNVVETSRFLATQFEINHGFALDFFELGPTIWEALTKAWVTLIRARRGEDESDAGLAAVATG